MFITRAIDTEGDGEVIAERQGRTDGGNWLDTYSHVTRQHGNQIAALLIN